MAARSVCGSHASHAPFLHSTCHGGRGWSKCTVTENQNTTAIVTQQTQSGETKTKHQVSLFYLSSSVCNSSHLAHNVGITPIPCFFALLFPTLRASQFRLLKPRVVFCWRRSRALHCCGVCSALISFLRWSSCQILVPDVIGRSEI